MKRVLKWFGISIVLLLGAALVIGYLLGPEDSCLDSGGCWDSIDKVCRKAESNAQELCDRSKHK